MKKLCAAWLLLAPMGAVAQSSEQVLRDAIVKKRMFLRDFSADGYVRGHWDGARVIMDEPKVRALAVFVANSVNLKADKLVIRGVRQSLVRDSETHIVLFPYQDNVSIEVALKGADMLSTVPKIKNSLFFSTLQEAMNALPDKYKAVFPPRVDQQAGDAKKIAKPCDCAEKIAGSCVDDGPLSDSIGIEPPHVKHNSEPEFPDEARQGPLNAAVKIGLVVDDAGHPRDLWIVRPEGMGLDKNAADAVHLFTFFPATCHGKRVTVDLFIDVNFQRF